MIYVAEDDQAIRDLVLYTLNASGFSGRGFETGNELLEAVREKKPDLILLDIMMPDEDGLSVLKKLKSSRETDEIPVILETARSTEFDTVTGLDLGADDYLSKPYGMMEMISRIRAVLRRTKKKETDGLIECGPLILNTTEHLVLSDGKQVVLTRKEYELLKLLMKNHRTVFTRDDLLLKVWSTDFAGETRTVDVHINTLRSKLGKPGECIKTVRGVGYRLDTRDYAKTDQGQDMPDSQAEQKDPD